MCNENDNLKLISVGEIINNHHHFFVDSYQRGYKWSIQNVLDLLDDINDFEIKVQTAEDLKEYIKKFDISNSCTLEEYQKYINKFNKEFYCLQPIVVKQKDGKYELIDGQQRLTSIFIILSILGKDNFEIDYKTRTRSHEFLNNVVKANEIKINEDELPSIDKFGELKKDLQKFINKKWNEFIECNVNYDNIDNYHFFSAYITIKVWVKKNKNENFYGNLTNLTKVIWYEIKPDDEIDSRDVFMRINSGKIPLTNAELIKALFLHNVPSKNNPEVFKLKQIQIAREWDEIEHSLQDDNFWYFLNGKKGRINTPTRIEFILNILSEKENVKESEFYSFEYFNKKIREEKNIENIWKEIKQCYYRLLEWYEDYEKYHLVGFLLTCGIKKAADLWSNSKEKTNIDFKQYLKNEIYNVLKKYLSDDEKGCSVDNIQYISGNRKNNDKIINILILFNIYAHKLHRTKLPFKAYGEIQQWSIEHIHAQNSKDLSDTEKWDDWYSENIRLIEEANIPIVDKNKLNGLLKEWNNQENADSDEAKNIYNKFMQELEETVGEFNEDEKDDICNLALLEKTDNSSIGNKIFSNKREKIIDLEKEGSFIPIATKNVFSKFYSKKVEQMYKWSTLDREKYKNAIIVCLAEYLPEIKEK